MATRERTASNASISKKMASKALGAVRSISIKRRPSTSSDADELQKPLKDKRASMIDDDGPGSGSDSDSPSKKRSGMRKLTQRFSMTRKRTGDLESGPLDGSASAPQTTDTGISPMDIPTMSAATYQEPASLVPPPDGAVDLGSRPGSPVVSGFQAPAMVQAAVVEEPKKDEVVAVEEDVVVVEAPKDMPDTIPSASIPEDDGAHDHASQAVVGHEDEVHKSVTAADESEDDAAKPPDYAIPDARISQFDPIERAEAAVLEADVEHHRPAEIQVVEATGYAVDAPFDGGEHAYKPLANDSADIHQAEPTSSDALISPPGAYVAGQKLAPPPGSTFWDWVWMPIKVPLVVARAVIVFTSRVLTAPFIALAGASRFVFRRMQAN